MPYDWISIGALVVAAYGAVLSTFNWRQAHHRDKRMISVRTQTQTPVYPTGQLGPCFLSVEAVNVGYRPVTIDVLTWELPNKSRLVRMGATNTFGLIESNLPTTLSDGDSARRLMAYREIAEALRERATAGTIKITPIAVDTVGNVYRGETIKVNVAEFSSM